MLASVQELLRTECLLAPDLPVVVGVSGGPDSLCLLDLLQQSGYPLLVAHFNHGLRPEAGADALAVQALAETRRLSFRLGQAAVGELAQSQGLSIEEAARNARYQFLFEQARQTGAQAVVVGHTADDQVETVLMHLLRGAGLAGLRGMPVRMLPSPWSAAIPLLRPLLGVWRSEVLLYCRARGLEPRQDITNLDTAYFRNRLRHELLPALESYNPAIRQVLWRTAAVLAADYALLDESISAAWQACRVETGLDYAVFLLPALIRQPPALQRHLLRRAAAVLRPGLRDIDFAALERALAFLARPSYSRQLDWIAGLRLLIEGDRLWLAAWQAQLPAAWPGLPSVGPFSLALPGEFALPDGWRLRAELVPEPAAALPAAQANADPFQAWVALDALRLPLQLRCRQPGDRFQPLGLTGQTVRLAEYMLNRKLPRRSRAAWPLVCGWLASSGAPAIVWAPGLALAYPFRLTAATRRAAWLQLARA